jgi:outer membrane protein W
MKWFIAVAVLLVPVSLFAQAPSNELGVFISTSQFESTSFTDEDGTFEIGFDEDLGYGVSYTRFFTPSVAIEFGAQRLGGDVEVSFGAPINITAEAGEINLNVYSATAQYHFPHGKLDPYIGGGVAYLTGDVDFIDDPEDPDSVSNADFDNELTWLANIGIGYAITDSVSIGADVKYIAYDPKAEGDTDEGRVDVNPLVIAGGVKFQF